MAIQYLIDENMPSLYREQLLRHLPNLINRIPRNYHLTKKQFMPTLSQEKCAACRQNSPRVTAYEIVQLKPQIPDWNFIEKEGVPQLERTYKFPDFKTALAFTNSVSEVAENEGHHPTLLTEWGKVTVTWWTHAISGLHRNDFIMAAKTDEIATQFSI